MKGIGFCLRRSAILYSVFQWALRAEYAHSLISKPKTGVVTLLGFDTVSLERDLTTNVLGIRENPNFCLSFWNVIFSEAFNKFKGHFYDDDMGI